MINIPNGLKDSEVSLYIITKQNTINLNNQ